MSRRGVSRIIVEHKLVRWNGKWSTFGCHLSNGGARRCRGGTTASPSSDQRSGRTTLADRRASLEEGLKSLNTETDQEKVKTEHHHANKLAAEKAKQDQLELALLLNEQKELLREAGAATRSLYRTCIRCTKVILSGNEHDERDFRKREEQQLKALEGGSGADMFSMTPPVDRDDELFSRSEYYHAYARENFEQESDCFSHGELWREAQVDRYLHSIRNGEHQRKWIMKEYKFDDPFAERFDTDRLERFATHARDILTRGYALKGWKFDSEIRAEERRLGLETDDFDDEADDSYTDQ